MTAAIRPDGVTPSIIRKTGGVRAAVSLGIPGLSMKDSSGRWIGMDADFARALAAATTGDPDAVGWLPVAPEDRVAAVRDGKADIGVCNASWTLRREAEVLFPGVLVHDGEGFLVHADLGVRGAEDLAGRRVVIQAGTTSAQNLARWHQAGGPAVHAVEAGTPAEAVRGYVEHRFDGYVLDRTALAGIRAGLADPERHLLLPDVISDEPLGPFVAPESTGLFVAARWVLHLLFAAEAAQRHAHPFDRAEADALGERIGLVPGWATTVLASVGHYGDMFARNLGAESPRSLPRGRNALWLDGGLHYAPPFR
ncbi:MAG TPA: transporter substrate-binding domain-containing protein [Pseudonocardiaceae bacterium]|nr:transporter substrate-binding domain-containing protein [Pseudonocardiaceae bacterium]